MQLPVDTSTCRSVEIVAGEGEWFVKVVENDLETTTPGFEREEFAVSFAEGQCIRLGVAGFGRR